MRKAKPAGRKVTDIPADRLAQLNTGAAARTLTECLAVDFAALMGHVLPTIGSDALTGMRQAAATGISRRMPLAARLIADHLGPSGLDDLGTHASDTVRGWCCFMIGLPGATDLADRLDAIRPFADDPHFGVREWAWMALRPHIAAELERAVALLADWTGAPSPNLRRFASEATRPRGVWCSHIGALRHRPELGLAILEPLRTDRSSYVRDSVGNWLNDASKDRPDWVRELCARWTAENPTPDTLNLCRRALRSLHPDQ
ncbi:DNA alkylation repair protein [Methylobacterium sp. WSM2598]|uniref:DNA alkylation repair protein n=1 Tax=Methylobacterium sp. WSM2598 TaxID=398261 RepID=UPI0003AA6057|nr:DNA alkylation repair protein [Methylobacterium sp. WSM2598]